MKAWTWISACALFGVMLTANAASTSTVSVSHFEPLQRLTISSEKLTFDALGKSYELQLEVNNRLLTPAVRAALTQDIVAYRGQLKGVANSWARVVIADGIPRGILFDGNDYIAIEAPGASAVDTDEPVIYRLADTIIPAGAMGCGVTDSTTNGSTMLKAMVGEIGAAITRKPGAVSEMSISVIGDYEYSVAHGANTEVAILSRINIVDGIFSEQLGVQFLVQTPEIFSEANDPFGDTTVASELLGELGDYRFESSEHNSHGLTHLFTGRILDTSTVGIAFTNELCSRYAGAGLTQANHSELVDGLIAAHEIGHNFGAPHDAQAGSACEAEQPGFLMATAVTGSDQFSACSITQMQDDIDAASCITPLPSVDMTVSLRGGPDTTALLSNRVVFEFDVTNRGTLAANNVVAEVTVPANLELQSTAISEGGCVTNGNVVSCPFGDMNGGSSSLLIVTANATVVGTEELNIEVSADADDLPENNEQAVQVTVDAAVNLVVSTPAASQLIVDQSRSITATISNESILNATNARISATFDAGLRVDNASWSIGSCTIAAQQVDCDAASLSAQSTSTLSFTVTGTSIGTKNYTVSMSADEADAFMPDNSIEGVVTVTTVDGDTGEEDSGGAAGPGFLWLLTVFVACYRRRALS